MADNAQVETVSITINGAVHEVPAGELLIAAAEDLGENIPRFCYYKKLAPVGKCRMCLVEVEGPRGKALIPSCTVPVSDGMVVDTESTVVKKAQKGVLEFLLINHPLDCPVCDKGGECPLQDQAVEFGPGESRFIEQKRTFTKPIPVSELVLLDRERCVLCDRCVRVADDIAGDPLIEFIDRGNHTQINTFPSEPFSSYFSGNTVQTCPVGALTSVDYRFKARPWDLTSTRSVSLADSVHSTVDVQTSMGSIVRVYGVENNEVNEGWLSDKDRFQFGAFQDGSRVTTPLVRDADGFTETTWAEAMELIASRLGGFLGSEVGAIGGANNTNEEAFVLGRFMRSVVGSPHIDAQIGDGIDPHLAAAIVDRATINNLDEASTILLWGPDLKETLPVLYLRVRKAVLAGASLVVVSPYATGLDSIATHVVPYRAGSGPEVLRKISQGEDEFAAVGAMLGTGPVVVLVGRTSLSEDPRLVEAAAAFARTLPESRIMPLLLRGNVFGALDMGLAPNLLPGRVSTGDADAVALLEDNWGPIPEGPGKGTMEMLASLVDGDLKAIVLAGSDPVRDCPDPQTAIDALENAEFVVAFDAFVTDSSRRADVILPAAVWGEVDGTATNLEGRVQRLGASTPPLGKAMSLATALDGIARFMGVEMNCSDWMLVNKEIATVAPAYGGLTADYLTFEAGDDGAIVPLRGVVQPLSYLPTDVKVPVVTDRFTLHLAPSMYDDSVVLRHATILSSLHGTAEARLHPKDASALAVVDGDVVEVAGIELPIAIDVRVVPGSVVLPFNQIATKGVHATAAVNIQAVRGDV
ncbi:MAG: NADH-quinone oxidoreductase subunit NuoG [Actinomycetia bacterium]|nr:NADH-quinone oxidoreductase subunit NuoG [Actinomycetes bacterium]